MGPKRKSDGASRVRGSDVDAGLHAETDAGPIDVGLALSDTAAGVVIDAPGLGMLRVAFEVAADGSIGLTALSRKTSAADLFVAPLLTVDKSQVAQLETPWDVTNVNGGAVPLGHPYGMSGVRYVGSTLMELARRKQKRAVVGVCTAGGMATAAYLERP